MYYSAGNFEAFAHPRKPEASRTRAHTSSARVWRRSRPRSTWCATRRCQAGTSMCSEKDVLPGGARSTARSSRAKAKCDARRSRDGQPFRGRMWDARQRRAEHRGRERLHARLLLPAQQGRPELLEVPRHEGPWPDAHIPTGSSTSSDKAVMEILKLYLAPERGAREQRRSPTTSRR